MPRGFVPALLALACATGAAPPAPRAPPQTDGGALVDLSGSGLTGARTKVEGCAAHPELADRPPTRTALPPAQVEVQPSPEGVRVVHRLPPACCLRAAITTEVAPPAAFVR